MMKFSDQSTPPARWILQPMGSPKCDYSNLKRLYFLSNTQIESNPRLRKLRRIVQEDPRIRKMESNEIIRVKKQPKMQHLKRKLKENEVTEDLTNLMIEADQLRKQNANDKKRQEAILEKHRLEETLNNSGSERSKNLERTLKTLKEKTRALLDQEKQFKNLEKTLSEVIKVNNNLESTNLSLKEKLKEEMKAKVSLDNNLQQAVEKNEENDILIKKFQEENNELRKQLTTLEIEFTDQKQEEEEIQKKEKEQKKRNEEIHDIGQIEEQQVPFMNEDITKLVYIPEIEVKEDTQCNNDRTEPIISASSVRLIDIAYCKKWNTRVSRSWKRFMMEQTDDYLVDNFNFIPSRPCKMSGCDFKAHNSAALMKHIRSVHAK